jgi:hypothetical protein
MRLITLLLALVLTACTSSCGQPPRVAWPSVAACAEPARDDLMLAVRGVLVDPQDGDSSRIDKRAVEQLEELARAHGPSTIACLVDAAVQGFDRAAPAGGRPPIGMVPEYPGPDTVRGLTDDELAAARGRDFLQRIAGTRIEASEP